MWTLRRFLYGNLQCCNWKCVDTSNDDNSCGTCGNKTPPNLKCCNSKFVDLITDLLNCGTCEALVINMGMNIFPAAENYVVQL